MGTKNDPAPHDAYAKAEPDEPLFTLLARDPQAPFLVSIWAKVRVGDIEAAFAVFGKMMSAVGPAYAIQPDTEKATEAMYCSSDMFAWQQANGKGRVHG
ncbi:hypothetical protein SAMN05216548_10735 [Faunimonas pinastri]|uniref:Uncharacterized protein n=1 Tax=Faunimonas pinastri TaxID=1855383 RepID=A0A1H9IAD3_9HYPH|nr:hypothetical protein [Faunimonas pinastri]SEQ71508.1 hypothetical protein SAMN05216548_10735 [Faunimonas pinastri]